MNWFKYLINIGTGKQNDVTGNKHIRFANSLALIICFFIIQNIVLSVYYRQGVIAFIQSIHFVMIALVLFFNYMGKRILASAWFSSSAIFFVTIYAIVFTLGSLNFTFLPFIIFLQFFLFPPADTKYIISFVIITGLCFIAVFVIDDLHQIPVVTVSQGLISAQRWNTVVGLPMLSAAIGAYAFFTIKKAEEETAREKEDLKEAQRQLIQSEKMASLGELTAGIAHEIQNPLNFVNNFSDVNRELISELVEEVDKGNTTEVKEIANDIKENEEKINHHGKRADAIVKGMLQHSRQTSGAKEATDINALADEYLRLAYHGLKAKDKSFNAEINTDFDNDIGKINVVPQDIGRVILNLINNAFYTVTEKLKACQAVPVGAGYEPAVSVSTKKDGDKILICVKDNGNGIPQKVLDKIFQPFFTTKPTGSGTGLGLSLSYDIVKAHGGEIKLVSKEGEGTEFVIELPVV